MKKELIEIELGHLIEGDKPKEQAEYGTYIRLFHGRDNPDDKLSDWGFNGPVIGPVEVGWTYGQLRIHPQGGDGRAEFNELEKGLIEFGGKYYGDMDMFCLHKDDPSIGMMVNDINPRAWENDEGLKNLLSYEDAAELME